MPIHVAILLGSPLTDNIFHRIGMPYLAHWFDVTIIDCTQWLRAESASLPYERHDYGKLVRVSSEAELKSAIQRMKPNYAIDFTGSGLHIRKIQNILRGTTCRYVAQRIAPCPLPNGMPGATVTWTRWMEFMVRGCRWLLRNITNQNPLPPDIALLAGSKSADHWTSSSKIILWTGSTDYFTMKELQHSRPEKDKTRKYALFIDDCLSLSMDYALTGQVRPIEPDAYFEMLRNTLSLIEERLSLPIVIAAHPSGKDMPHYASHFGNRAVHFHATANLSLDCEVALTHYSTAITYPVLLRKPIILLHAHALRETFQGRCIENLQQLLKCSLFFMDDRASASEALVSLPLQVDQAAYDTYVKSYINSSPGSHVNPFEPFVRFATG